MAAKLSLILGAATQDGVNALVIAQGLGSEVPRVIARARGATTGAELIPRRLVPGPSIAARLTQCDVSVFRVKVPASDEVVLEACVASGNAEPRKSAPFRGLPATLAHAPGGLTVLLATCTYYWAPDLQWLKARTMNGYGLGPAPSFALLAGDNVYLDLPKPEDQQPANVVDRYLEYFLDPGYTDGRACMPSFTTYDDHEYWNDYPELTLPVSLWLSTNERPVFEQAAKECLELFQRSINPPPADRAKLAYRIDVPPVSFFVVDTRSTRQQADEPGAKLMPDDDMMAFEDWAAGLKGPGVLVIGQPLWIEPIMTLGPFASDHNVSHFRAQYDRICSAIENAPYDVLVLSGDVHYSRLLTISTAGRRTLNEVVASPLVSIPGDGASLVQMMFGGWKAPEASHSIDDTTQAPRAGWSAQYKLGTGSGTAFALLNFKPAGANVDVELSFIDLRKGSPADLVTHTALGSAVVPLAASGASPVCWQPNAFTLRPKLP